MVENEEKPKASKKKRVIQKPKFPTNDYVLIQDVVVNGVDGLQTRKKGTKISLTKQGAIYFKLKNFIK